jgi:6-phosphogluconolactonase
MLSRAAAELFVRQANLADRAQGRFSVALSGGQTPRRTYELLAQPDYRDRVAWTRVHVFWGDERCVPLEDHRNNARLARQTLLKHVPIPEEQIYPIKSAISSEKAAQEYEALLRLFFAGQTPRFDLIFLGLGADGHTASLFPGTAAACEQKSWTTTVPRHGLDPDRVTLTLPLINQARAVVFLVAGKDKALVLKKVLSGYSDLPPLPAQLINPGDGELYWLVDDGAAVLINGFTGKKELTKTLK